MAIVAPAQLWSVVSGQWHSVAGRQCNSISKTGGYPKGRSLPMPALDPNIQLPSSYFHLDVHRLANITWLQTNSFPPLGSFSAMRPPSARCPAQKCGHPPTSFPQISGSQSPINSALYPAPSPARLLHCLLSDPLLSHPRPPLLGPPPHTAGHPSCGLRF